mmetsp:Transcript_137751/g.239537  ORF Transcript_137751/g.239537 Transcript_137751/m.239537 type:complete len:257 (+) Transcript_137751:1283-2053(+)
MLAVPVMRGEKVSVYDGGETVLVAVRERRDGVNVGEYVAVKERLTVGRVRLTLRVVVRVVVVEKEHVAVPVRVAARVRDGVSVPVGLGEKEPEDRVGETQLGLGLTLGVWEADRVRVRLRDFLRDSEWLPVGLGLKVRLGVAVKELTEGVGVTPLGLRLNVRETSSLTVFVRDGWVLVPVRDQLGLEVAEQVEGLRLRVRGLRVRVTLQVALTRWLRVKLTVRLWVLVGPLRDQVGVHVAVGVRVRLPVTTDGEAV